MRGTFTQAVQREAEIIHSYWYKCAARQEPAYFSREGGKIGFTNMIGVMLNFLTKSMQIELDKFFAVVAKKTESVSKQAFIDARYKLKAEAFQILFDDTAAMACEMDGMKTYKGYRVLPVDGSTVKMEDTYSLRGYFGVDGGCAAGRVSVATDVLNKGLIIDARLDKMSCSERELAMRHAERIRELEIQNPLLVFDRGYASAELFEKLGDMAYLFRLQRSFNAEIDSMPVGDYTMRVAIKGRPFQLRVMKFALSTGEVETLVTNLPGVITPDDLKELYRLRWGVETAYRSIKGALQLENFSGTAELFVKQDFYATMFLKNMAAFAKMDADETIEEQENPNNKYRKKVNENMMIGIMKDQLVWALLSDNPRTQARRAQAVIRKCARYTVPIRPDRHFPRKRKHSKRFYASGKSAL